MTKEKQNPKYEQIIYKAKTLFWKHGVTRVTVEEICEQADVSKRTFYKHFSNKKALAKIILERILQQNINQFKSIVYADMPFSDKAKKMILLKFESSEGISAEFINDIYKNKKLGLYQYIQAQTEKSKALFADLINDAKKKGEIRKKVKTEFVMAYLDQLSNMTANPELMAKYNDTREMIMDSIEFLFYGLGVER
jgi:AcrR family transcriptional regulator